MLAPHQGIGKLSSGAGSRPRACAQRTDSERSPLNVHAHNSPLSEQANKSHVPARVPGAWNGRVSE